MSRVHNKLAKALTTLASKIDVPEEVVDVRIMKRHCEPPQQICFLLIRLINEIGKILSFKILNQPSSNVAAKDLKNFIVINGKVYFQGSAAALTQAFSLIEVKEEYAMRHDISSEENDISFYRRL